jgi:hypothetical protein
MTVLAPMRPSPITAKTWQLLEHRGAGLVDGVGYGCFKKDLESHR